MPSSSTLNCNSCNAEISSSSDVFFYVKSKTQILISIKPEREYVLRSRGKIKIMSSQDNQDEKSDFSQRKKKAKLMEDVLCAKCSSSIGKLLPYGPNNANFVSFTRLKVQLCGVVPPKKSKKLTKFWQLYQSVTEWKEIEQRNDDNFRQPTKNEVQPLENNKYSRTDDEDNDNILFLPAAKDKDQSDSNEIDNIFGWSPSSGMITKSIPRPYQITAFLQSLTRCLILVLPTGAGKTLVATLLLLKLQTLNRSNGRMGLFIVDRIPLVFQQGNYISRQTNGVLRVCTLCGENMSQLEVKKLTEKKYDVLVITAGALLNLIQLRKLNLGKDFHCIVFDECHHASGKNHVYSHILQELNNVDASKKPRVLGLTASPVAVGNTFSTSQKRLRDLCDKFGSNVEAYCPENLGGVESGNDIRVEQVDISRSRVQRDYACWIIAMIKKFRSLVGHLIRGVLVSNVDMDAMMPWNTGLDVSCRLVLDEDRFDIFLSATSLGRLRGAINTLQDFLNEEHNLEDEMGKNQMILITECLWTMKGLIGALETSEVLGVTFGNRIIADIAEDACKYSQQEFLSLESDLIEKLSAAYQELNDRCACHQDKNNAMIISPRLKRLEHELRKVASSHSGHQSRILVIVHTRAIARDLTKHLNAVHDLASTFNPDFVVGHGGFDGMDWEGEQEVAIRKFSSSEGEEGDKACRLLISTSVLEEGLDVASCDLVIRLQGVHSLISFIQSRGRARRGSRSRMLVFSTEREFARIGRVRDGESTMRMIVRQRSAVDKDVQKIENLLIKKYQSDEADVCFHVSAQHEDDGSPTDDQTVHSRPVGSLPIFTLWIPFKKHIDQKVLEQHLQDSLELSGLTSLHITNVAHVEDLSVNTIFDNASGYMIGLSCIDEELQNLEVVTPTLLNRVWNYKVNNELVWLQQHSALAASYQRDLSHDHGKQKQISFKQEQLNSLAVGSWVDTNTYSQRVEMGRDRFESYMLQSVIFTEKKGFSVMFKVLEKSFEMEVSQNIIFYFALLDYCKEKNTFQLFLPLRSTPLVYIKEGADMIRVSHPDFPLASTNVLCLSFNANQLDLSVIRKLQTDYIAVPIFETKVRILNDSAAFTSITNEFQFIVYENGEKIVDPHKDSFPSFNTTLGETRDVHWMLLTVFSQRLGCFTNSVRAAFWNFTVQLLDCHQLEFLHDDCLGKVEVSCLLFALNQCLNLPYWADAFRTFKSNFESIYEKDGTPASIHAMAYEGFSPSPERNIFKIYSLIHTPTRIIYTLPKVVKGSRLFRNFGSERFISCSFRDEQGQHLHGDQLVDCVQSCIYNGITAAGRDTLFFGASNSQLRGKQLLFMDVESLPSVNSIDVTDYSCQDVIQLRLQVFREMIVKPPKRPIVPAQYLSKLALFCTSDTPTICLPEEDVVCYPDVVTCLDRSILTDGAGVISRSLAEEVSYEYLGLSNVPAAFQIRWRGVKGVLVVVDDDSPLLIATLHSPGVNKNSTVGLSSELKDVLYAKVMIRQSMKKCDSGKADDGRLCVVMNSKFFPMLLNREIINLLSSIDAKLFDPHSVLEALMVQALEEKVGMFADADQGLAALSGDLDSDVQKFFDTLRQHTDLLQNPIWIELLQAKYKFLVRDLIEKTRIPIKNGCRLLGIPDPIGILQDGEIFVFVDKSQDRDNNNENCVGLNGRVEHVLERDKVVIWRNPCLHPGDVRIVRAVNYPSLHSWKNVVIFPSNDDCQRNIPMECSGGDLDGDQFYVLWEEGLIPPRNTECKPLPYHTFEGSDNRGESYGKSAYFSNVQLCDFICNVFRNDFLGRLTHMHTALSDGLEFGARNPICCEIAKALSFAVDFPKTGIAPLVPKETDGLVKQNGYPDFMEKSHRPGYLSRRTLGLLYRRAKWFDFNYKSVMQFGSNGKIGKKVGSEMKADRRLLLPGREKFRDEAQKYHTQYICLLQSLMISYGLKSEAECLLGHAVAWHPMISDKGKAANTVRIQMLMIQKSFSGIFNRLYNKNNTNRQLAASAWYEMAHENSWHAKSFTLVVGHVILEILAKEANCVLITPGGSEVRVGQAILSFYKVMQPQVIHLARARLEVRDFVRHSLFSLPKGLPSGTSRYPTLLSDSFSLSVYGSIGQGLCVEASDLDIVLHVHHPQDHVHHFCNVSGLSSTDYVGLAPHYRENHFLETCVAPALSQISTSQENVLNARVPIIRAAIDGSTISCSNDAVVNIDVTCNLSGLIKTQWLQRLFLEDPAIYAVFCVLMRWFRAADLMSKRIDKESKGKISPGGMSMANAHSKIFSSGDCQALILFILQDEFHDSATICYSAWSEAYDKKRRLEVGSGSDFVDQLDNEITRGRFFSTDSATQAGLFLLRFFEKVNKYFDEVKTSPEQILEQRQRPIISFQWPCPEKLLLDGRQVPGLFVKDNLLEDDCQKNLNFLCNKIYKEQLNILRLFCEPARHCLLVCGDVTQLLEQAAGDGKFSTFARKLPTSLSYRIGTATQFFSQRLACASGCEVKLEELRRGSGRLKIFAQGSRLAIMKLREELTELVIGSSNKCLSKGNASIYSMEEASGMWLLCSEDAEIQIKFKDVNTVGNSSLKDNFRNKVIETSVCRAVNCAPLHDCSSQNQIIEVQNSDYGNMGLHNKQLIHVHGSSYSLTMADLLAIQELNRLLFRQVHKMPHISSFVDVKLTASFGIFIVVDKSKMLPETRRTLSMKELLRGMVKVGRNRQKWDRHDPNQLNQKFIKKKENYETVSMKTGKTKKRTSQKVSSTEHARKRGIQSTFVPTFGGIDYEGLQDKFEVALKSCGYKFSDQEESNWKEVVDNDMSNSIEYFIQFQISRGYELKAYYSDKLFCQGSIATSTCIQERALNWVHFTLLGNGKFPDVRIRLRSTAPLSDNLRHMAKIDRSPIFWNKVSNNAAANFENLEPKFYSNTPLQTRQKVHFVRRLIAQKKFQKEICGCSVVAKISRSIDYHRIHGDNIDSWKPCKSCSITLEFPNALENIDTFDSKCLAFIVFYSVQELGKSISDCEVSFDV